MHHHRLIWKLLYLAWWYDWLVNWRPVIDIIWTAHYLVDVAVITAAVITTHCYCVRGWEPNSPCYVLHQWSQSDIENNVCTPVTNCFSTHKRVILVFISWVAKQRGNKCQSNTRVGAEIVRHESGYIILFLTRHNESINDDKNYDL